MLSSPRRPTALRRNRKRQPKFQQDMLRRKARSYAGGEKSATHRELGEMSWHTKEFTFGLYITQVWSDFVLHRHYLKE